MGVEVSFAGRSSVDLGAASFRLSVREPQASRTF
jgi:hypothetical protein